MSKFVKDNIEYEDNSIILCTHGVFFTNVEDIPYLYGKYGETFMTHLRGSQWGELYDKNKDLRIIWNDQIGDKLIFYSINEGNIVYSPQLTDVIQSVKEHGQLQYDQQFIWSALTYGYSPTCHTLYSSIRRIPAGHYLRIQQGEAALCCYHRFDNIPNAYSLDENIERLDELFSQAVARALRKNEQYGYRNYLPLSAGLDSRMTVRVAHQLAKDPIVAFTYSQSNHYDAIVPREIASYLGIEWHFRPLDGGDYLQRADDISLRTSGLVNYTGAAQAADSLDTMPTDSMGIILTGMLGDIVLNAHYNKKDTYRAYETGEGAICHTFIRNAEPFLSSEIESQHYNKETGYLYIRGFNCANLGSPVIQQKDCESYSPYCDVDFLTFALSIPNEQRFGYKIYDEWIKRKYPDMMQWMHNGTERIGHRSHYVSIAGRTMPIQDVAKRMYWFALKRLHIANKYKLYGNSMNPEDEWLETNQNLSAFVDNYIARNRHEILKQKEFSDAIDLLLPMSATEKLQVLSLMAALHNF